MFRDYVIAIGFALIITGGVWGALDHSNTKEANQPQNFSQSTVQLGHFCSGTVIADPNGKGKPTVLTARHCVIDLITGKVEKEIVPITVKTYDSAGRTIAEDPIDFKVVRVSDKSDLAILQTESSLFNLPALSIFDGVLRTGDHVFAVGYPGGAVLTVTDGFIGPIEQVPAISPISTTKEIRRSTTLIAPGSSGGSLVAQTDNGPRLVGVATGVNIRIPFMTYCLPVEEIRSLHSTHSL